ncbi:MAG: NADH-quinone oxidoreductase subunit B family protein [Thermoplasmataceae archaeon]
MSNLWFLEGIKKGIKTESFPKSRPQDAPEWPSRLVGKAVDRCPVNAFVDGKWVEQKCIFCRRCLPESAPSGDQDIFTVKNREKLFKRSLHIFPLDSGACGACNMELFSIFSPQYDANRLGIFIVNTPRHADAIVVMGVMTEGMANALQLAYDAMPEPKLVIALGACALSGGIVGKPPLDSGKYNVEISGCPPSPYTILAAIDAARKDHAERSTTSEKGGGE